MDIILQIDEPFAPQVDGPRLEQAAVTALQHLNRAKDCAVTIVVTDNPTIRELNRQFRGIDAATDVLSFENVAGPDFPPFDQRYLGDIIIAYPQAEAQALARGHTAMEELALLAVHGLLHLAGYNHDTPARKQEMWAVQQEIMGRLGLAHIQPTEG